MRVSFLLDLPICFMDCMFVDDYCTDNSCYTDCTPCVQTYVEDVLCGSFSYSYTCDHPTMPPTKSPTFLPSNPPSPLPTQAPTPPPSQLPSELPTPVPTPLPSMTPTVHPKPGMVVWAPPVLVVSEDGVTRTAALSLRLTSEPLSAVYVTLNSSHGGVHLSPSTITFDYTNFAKAVNVTVTGVDDYGNPPPSTIPVFFLSPALFCP